ncbi:malate synthase A [Oceanobacillus kimchii]|uniref:malate synthase A n=1 Tax=Oceanobacillus kimchii TaxID=746691 RepID=UPI0009847FD5|nr:malate synthase A [Oceanobacillus kimchii]
MNDVSILQSSSKVKYEDVLTTEARGFLFLLHQHFNQRRKELLDERQEKQKRLADGEKLNFLSLTKHIRESDWEIDPVPKDLKDRRVEITGPVDRKMIINALNSGANTFMADFEDASSPTWENMMQGQRNLKDAIRREIDFFDNRGKEYRLNDKTAVLIVRPRGWHLEERHIKVENEPMSASLVDFGLYFFHNAKELIRSGSGPYFYLPKMENYLEARLWNDVFVFAQNEIGIPQGTIKATVLIETITAAFEMDEILYELRHHSAGLNCGRWDYIFSFIKKNQSDPAMLLPDRSTVTMETPFMRSYSLLAIQTCHRRNAHAIGGMAAQIPVKNNKELNRQAFEKVKKDKEREVRDGHDGTWVAHPGMVQLVKDVYDLDMPAANQINRKREDIHITANDLLQLPTGPITIEGLRTNITVGIQYMAAWLSGRGAVPINNLMEDAATAEISRAQIWQWIQNEAIMDNEQQITFKLVKDMVDEVVLFEENLGTENMESEHVYEATNLFLSLIKQKEFEEFLTLPAYHQLNEGGCVNDK